MRNLLLFCVSLFLVFTQIILAQIPNSGFEQWSNGEPVDWYTNNFTSLGLVTVTQTSDAHSGSSALKGEVIPYNNSVYYSLIISGKIGEKGFPVSERHAAVSGYYKLNAVGGEKLNVVAAMYKNGKAIGVGGLQFQAAANYTNFSLPIYYNGSLVPDSCQISITLAKDTGSVQAGTNFYLDDITFQGIATSVEETSQIKSYKLFQNYPNPFNPSTTISYQIPSDGFVSLKIYNTLGKEVATLIDEYKTVGNYEVEFNLYSTSSNLASGVYFYQLSSGSFVQTKKMILIK